MTVTDSLIKISEWLNKEVCPMFKFKQPPGEGAPINDKWNYEEVHPHAFPLFIPAKDKLPPNVPTNMPSVCVQLLNGSDDLTEHKRDLTINLGISTWNPGIHSKDIYYPEGTRPEEPAKYRSGYDGWMDVWNFVDAVVRKLESITGIEGLYLAPEASVTFGPYKDQDTIPDYYPHWFAYVQFTVRSDFLRNNPEVEELL